MAERNDIAMVQRFDGKNFRQWKFQIKCALRAKGLDKVVTGVEVKPNSAIGAGDAVAVAAATTAIEKWDKKDGAAMCILTTAMDFNQITLIENCSTSKEVIDKLDSIYEQKSAMQKMLVNERFHSYKMTTESISQHVATVENLAHEVRDTGENVTDSTIVMKIISTLPAKYRNLRQAWLSLDENKQTIGNLTARLLDEEANLTKEDTACALTASAPINYRKPKFDIKKVTCYNCQKLGHFARDCRNERVLPPANRKKSESTLFHGNSGSIARTEEKGNCSSAQNDLFEHASAYVIEDVTLSLTSVDEESSWILDSGASAHMTGRRDYFATYEESRVDTTVMLGDSSKVRVAGKGIVIIKKFLNGSWCDAFITNVLHVPGLKKNLFSEGVITRRGMTIVKEGDRAEIFENGRLSASAVREKNNFFRMLFCVHLTKEERAVEKTEVSEREVPETEEEDDARRSFYGEEKLQENNYLEEEESRKKLEENNYLEKKETIEGLKEIINRLKGTIKQLLLEKENHQVDDAEKKEKEDHSEVNQTHAQNHHQPENSNSRQHGKLGRSSSHDLSLTELIGPMKLYEEAVFETNLETNKDLELNGVRLIQIQIYIHSLTFYLQWEQWEDTRSSIRVTK